MKNLLFLFTTLFALLCATIVDAQRLVRDNSGKESWNMPPTDQTIRGIPTDVKYIKIQKNEDGDLQDLKIDISNLGWGGTIDSNLFSLMYIECLFADGSSVLYELEQDSEMIFRTKSIAGMAVGVDGSLNILTKEVESYYLYVTKIVTHSQ